MGSIRHELDEINLQKLSKDVICLIERMLDTIDEKDKKLSTMQETIDNLRKREGQLKTSVDDKTRKLAETQQEVEEFKKKEKQHTNNVESKQKEIAKLQERVNQLISAQKQLEARVDSLSATLRTTILPRLVENYSHDGEWSVFKKAKVLDKSSEAYRQLSDISKQHAEPLRSVCSNGRSVAALSLLLDAGLSTGAVVGGGSGDTLLHAAAAAGDLQPLQLLLDRGANVAARNSQGKTPLSMAAARGHAAAAGLLLAHGANPGDRDAEGATAMHWAAEGGHLEVVKLLVDCGDDVTAKSAKGATPFDWAKINGHNAVVVFLSAHVR